MAKFEVPTIFTAIDKFSAKVNKMGAASDKFGMRAHGAATRANRSFDKLFPSIGSGAKQFAQFATAGLLFTGVMAGISNSVKVIADFEQANASLAAVTGKTVDQNKALAADAKRLGSITSKTATEVVGLQENLSRLSFVESEVLNMTEGIINGSVAMNSELARTAELTGAIVKTFDNISSADTATTIDQMTLATQRSALNFEKLETALPIVGAAANAAGVSFETTLSLLGKLSDSGVDASSSATALRNIFLDSAKKGLSYEQILEQITKNQDKLTAANDEFGKRGAISAVILAKNIQGTKELSDELTSLRGAEDAGSISRTAADKQLDTLNGTITLLGSAYEGFILSLDEGNGVFGSTAKNVIRVVTEMFNLASGVTAASETLTPAQQKIRSFAETALFLVKTLGVLFISMMAIKTALVVWRAATVAMNVVIGIHTALTKGNIFALRGNMIAMNAYRISTVISTAAQWLATAAMTGFTAIVGLASSGMATLSAVLLANPIGLVIAAIVALIAFTVIVIRNWDEWGAAAMALFALVMPGFALLISLVMTFRKHWDSISDAFSKGGFIEGLKAIGVALVDMVITPLEQILMLISKVPGLEGIATSGLDGLAGLREDLGIEQEGDEVVNTSTATEEQRIIREQNTSNNSVLTINSPEGAVNEGESSLSDDITLSSTLSF